MKKLRKILPTHFPRNPVFLHFSFEHMHVHIFNPFKHKSSKKIFEILIPFIPGETRRHCNTTTHIEYF